MSEAQYSDLTLYRRLLKLARPYWLHILGIFALSLLSTPLTLLTPLPMKIVVDSFLDSKPLPGFLNYLLPTSIEPSKNTVLVVAIALLVVITLLSQLKELAGSLLYTFTGEKLILDLRAQLFRHVQRLSFLFHDTRGTADSIYRIQKDASSIQSIAINGVIPFITSGFTLISMLYIIFRLDHQLLVIALAVTPALFILSRTYKSRLRRQSRQVKELESSAMSVVQEVLTGVRVVQAFSQEDREHVRFKDSYSKSIPARIRLALAGRYLGLFTALTTAIGTAAVIFVGARHVQTGVLTLGDLLLILSYLGQLYGPLKTISNRITKVQSHLTSAERVFSLLDEVPDVVERPNARPIHRALGSIAFRNVSFAYNGNQPVLHNISFEIPSGTCVGIAGRTGAGKTTLVSLLNRFFDPTDGQILLDGIDIRDYKLNDLRNQFSIVLQEPVLFSSTIAENIAYARPSASMEDIIRAATFANAHGFSVELPNGYNTLVGERGMRLSGGERQRISLARAFLKDAQILILDEPTSSIDMETESEILGTLERLIHNRTTFIVSHRRSTLDKCEVIFLIEEGQPFKMTSKVKRSASDLPSDKELSSMVQLGK